MVFYLLIRINYASPNLKAHNNKRTQYNALNHNAANTLDTPRNDEEISSQEEPATAITTTTAKTVEENTSSHSNPVQILQEHYANQTLVRFQTNLTNPYDEGRYLSFDIALYNNDTPHTVSNFLSYVDADKYNDVFIHRLVDNFIVQSGGYRYDEGQVYSVYSGPAVVNEYQYSNVTGTIAMAKIGGDPDSATNQFFFNLSDNSSNLDNQNGGFTVFGEILAEGMSVMRIIENLNSYDLDGPDSSLFDNVPIIDHTLQTLEDNLVSFTDISVITVEQHHAWLSLTFEDYHGYFEQLTGQLFLVDGIDIV